MFLILLSIVLLCSGFLETCKFTPLKDTMFCNMSIPYDERVSYLIGRLTSSDKIGQLVNTAPGINFLNISDFQWWEEALHGVAFSPGAHFTGPASSVTSFPQVINTGRTFDVDLFYEIGNAISDEARAMSNLKLGYLSFWTPNTNIFRDPRWGRGQETPGEDPYLSSQYVIHFLRGMQGTDDRYLKTNPCCKHYLVYNLEDYPGMDRYHFNAIVTDQDLYDTYLPAFKACVESGHVRQVMCSYNEVNGVPSCANDLFQNKVLRDDWGFEGHVVSDCGAISAIYSDHKYKPTVEETCEVALKGGCDLNCGSFYGKNLQSTLSKGLIDDDDLNTALSRLFMERMVLGEFDPWEDQDYRQIGSEVINSKKHQELSLRAAQESMTLLKNGDDDDDTSPVLPILDPTTKKIAVIGPNAMASQTLQGNYIGPPPYIVTALAGIEKYATNVRYEKGCDIDTMDKSGFKDAEDAAEWADLTILVMGIDGTIENEMKDRTSIEFPGVQSDLIQQIRKTVSSPIILVVISGGQIDISWEKENLDAILWAGYPSQSGGDAIADVLFGKISPAGRLAFTLYNQSYLDQAPYPNINMRPSGNYPGRTYRFYTGTPIYEFGTGKSYTTFKYDWKDDSDVIMVYNELEKEQDDDVSFEVKVTNTGKVTSDCVVLAFVTNKNAKDAPLKELFGFKRLLEMKSGESRSIYFPIGKDMLKYINKNGKEVLLKGEYIIQIEDLKKTVRIV